MKFYFAIIIGLLSLACGAGSPPSKTIETFMKAVCDDDAAKAVDVIANTSEIAPKTIRIFLSAGAKGCKQKGGFSSFQVDDEKVEGETATVNGKALYNDKSEEPMTMKLVKKNGNWKLMMQNPEQKQKSVLQNPGK